VERPGRPDADAVEAMMARTDRQKDDFVAFDFSHDALTESDAHLKRNGRIIIPLAVSEILNEQIGRELACVARPPPRPKGHAPVRDRHGVWEQSELLGQQHD
jgi:hypothetical protein